jgi:hypothetical protein
LQPYWLRVFFVFVGGEYASADWRGVVWGADTVRGSTALNLEDQWPEGLHHIAAILYPAARNTCTYALPYVRVVCLQGFVAYTGDITNLSASLYDY